MWEHWTQRMLLCTKRVGQTYPVHELRPWFRNINYMQLSQLNTMLILPFALRVSVEQSENMKGKTTWETRRRWENSIKLNFREQNVNG
jgi:hypothetical protein